MLLQTFYLGTRRYEHFETDDDMGKPKTAQEELGTCKELLRKTTASLRDANRKISGDSIQRYAGDEIIFY